VRAAHAEVCHMLSTRRVPSSSSCAWSARESLGFFCFTDAEWRLKREIFVESLRQSAVDEHPVPYIFWQNNWEPNFSCAFERRPGAPGDGAKWVCDPHRIEAASLSSSSPSSSGCLLYSFGSANNFRWEESMHELLPSCEIHTFDHTVKNGSVQLPEGGYVQFRASIQPISTAQTF
jgi:hypothetical protein